MTKLIISLVLLPLLVLAPSISISKETDGKQVLVTNFPSIQPVEGTLSVDNFPPIQSVDGDISVISMPPVEVVSTASNPLIVQDLGEPTRQVFQQTLSGFLPEGRFTVVAAIQIPDGKRLILEFASAKVFLPLGQNQKAYVDFAAYRPTSVEHYISLNLQGDFPTFLGTTDVYLGSQKMKMYVEPQPAGGNDLSISVNRSASVGQGYYIVNISGELTDME